jgi:hypothetical protein
MAYGKAQQPMDFKWQIARKIDRLDMGDYTTISRFNRLVVIYGLVRAINPKESKEEETAQQEESGDKYRSIADIITDIDMLVKKLRTPEEKIKMSDEGLGSMDSDIESQLDGFWYDLAEIIFRCKITDNVRVSEEAAP